MEFNREGLEEFFSDGVLNPATTSEPYLQNSPKFKEVTNRVFLLHEPDPAAFPNGPDFDIVLLHGIGSDEFKCWTNAQGIVWPAVFFPQDFPMARVLTVGYAHALFNWKVDARKDAGTPAKPLLPLSSSTEQPADGSVSPSSASSQPSLTEESDPLRHIKSLADRVGQSARESASTLTPKEVSEWWTRESEPRHRGEEQTSQTLLKTTVDTAAAKEEDLLVGGASTTQAKQNQYAGNTLFQLLTSIRDSTGSLVAAEDESSAGNLSGSTPEADEAAKDKAEKPSRDIRSLQNMRVVAAELAERLGSPEVGVGQRPVVFLVHSMGGLMLKQMLISLFEAARLAPPSAAALSLATDFSAAERTTQAVAVSRSCAAVQKANVLLRAVRGVVFYGTPHFGSAVASVITGLQKYYQGLGGLTPTSVVTGLGDHNKHELMRLNDRFFDVIERVGGEPAVGSLGSVLTTSQSDTTVRNYVAAMESSLTLEPSTWTASSSSTMSSAESGDRARGTVWIVSFGETKKLNGLVRVVDPESANPAPDDPRYPFYLVNADHGEICRPLTKMSPSYAIVYGMLDRMQQRGRLKWQHGQALPASLFGGIPAPTPSGSPGETTKSSAIEKMGDSYESGWSVLFDPSRLMSRISGRKEDGPAAPPVAPSSVYARSCTGNQRCLRALQQGLGETRLALPVLEAALADLHQLLHRFFGVAIPPQLDSIFLLAADVMDFVTRFYEREALTLQTCGSEGEAADSCPDGHPLVDEMVSFRVPLQLLIYWARQAADLLRVFELSQQERAIGIDATSGASPTAAKWESNLSMHSGSRDLRELGELEQSVGVVQEEWEAFRRYVSLRHRASSTSTTVRATQSDGRSRRPKHQNKFSDRAEEPADLVAREHIAVLFFARAIRTIVSQHLHDGGALGGLLGAYLRSAILQIRGSEKQLSPVHLEHDPWAVIEYSGSTNAESVVALVIEGLELSITQSSALQSSSVLMDTSGSGVELTPGAELRAAVPALTATSSVLLGCFALYVDGMHRLDGGARWPRAARHFQLAVSSLKADLQVRGRLLRAASRTMQREGLVPGSRQDSGEDSRGAEKDWWRTAWALTTSNAEDAAKQAGGSSASSSSSTAAGAIAAAFTDNRQAHVAKLDDGLFLFATQLVAESCRCSLLIRACRARQTLVVGAYSLPSVEAGERTLWRNAGFDQPEEMAGDQNATTDDPVDDLVRSVEAAQEVYLRTSQILRGVFALSDTETPFALEGCGADRRGAEEKDEGVLWSAEKSMKVQLRDAVKRILSELDEDEGEAAESNKSAEPQRNKEDKLSKKAGEAPQILSWTSRASVAKRQEKQSNALVKSSTKSTAVGPSAAVSATKKSPKNSLATRITNSLSKAWEAVRSGGASVETPEHFAYTAMVLWWMVEWEAAEVFNNAASVSLQTEKKAAATSSSASTSHANLQTLFTTMEARQQRRREVTTNASKAATKTSVASAAAEPSPAPRVKEAEKWVRQFWSNANAAIRCRWMTLRGGEEFLRSVHSELLADRDTLKHIFTSTSVDQLREMQVTLVPPAALMQLDGEGGTQLGIPSSLLDAVQHDNTSAALRCWLGHCYAAHRVGSPDTAHAYLQVIRNDYAAHKEYTPTAEVGLAWSHIHNVPCRFSQLWRATPETNAPAPRASPGGVSAAHLTRGGNCVDVRTTASLLGFRPTGVVDTSALFSVPPHLVQFCHDAVVHHAHAVQDYRKLRSTSQSPFDPVALAHSLSLAPPSVHARSLRHLQLAEEGFQRALRADPANVGALCGLGRLRCLSVSSSLSSCGVHEGATSLSMSTALHPPCSHGVVGATSTEAVDFFAAALNSAAATAHTRLPPESDSAARRASPENCAHAMDHVWLSYAAYWMSEEARRVRMSGGGPTRPLNSNHQHVSASAAWLLKSLRYYPRNDWALTSLGLSYLRDASTQPPTPRASRENETLAPCGIRKEDELELLKLRGLTLLQRALTINPANMWALWGVGTYGVSTPNRTTCQQLLRSLVLKNIPRV
ncbi:hypothetical protein ABB37_06697 [Leptomonas pyrrhocoris]|uniref:DUF676 domain-containing protein n=1 Tax=Leptomonas pyrrhocoris TaxID=157538 RepID=A0A0N0DTS7_LEPPY|nr:hypothetical protein ABB37_06697 [Leptomonas pyrrhocoris]KPA77918.1 hypothetical protein ABB37_06697 [Leptomonas pyrrhocoris]|eukprot:XP_015656357.1 hypothetical protein ABB37_06697 [Leptomonas pyrrhocoris]